MDLLDQAGQVAIELTLAIKGGDIPALERLLAARPGLATAGIIGRKCPEAGVRTPLHIVTDWPGYFRDGPAIAGILSEAGADPAAIPGYAEQTAAEAAAALDTRRENLVSWLSERQGHGNSPGYGD